MASQLLVITYPSPDDAERVVQTLRRLESEHLLQLEDLVYCERQVDGNLSVYESINRPLKGAALGAFWGAFLGKCFDTPGLGAAIGAAGGALVGGLTSGDGIDQGFVHQLTTTMPPGSSAVFALVSRFTRGRIMPELGKFGGTVIHTSLPEEDEDRLQTALDDAHRKAVATRSASTMRVRARRVVRHS